MTELFSKFAAEYINDGYPSQIGNISSISGQTNTMTQGLEFEYLYQQDPDNYVDEIDGNNSTVLFKSQDGIGRVVLYEDSTRGYRTIYSTFIFGALRDGLSTKQELMDIYLDYLTGNQ